MNKVEEERNLTKDTGCLIIHGFGGNVGEVEYLADYLQSKGYNVLCPSLKGHTDRRKDLAGVIYTDWIKSAEEGLIKIMEKSKKVFIVGFSMGGLIGLNLCEKYDIDGLVTLNTPIYYWDIKNIFSNIISDFKTGSFENVKRYLLSSRKFPIAALYNFRRLLSITKPKIGKIQCPILIAQANDDDTVRRTSAEYIFTRVGSKKKEIKYYDNSGHLILTSLAAKKVSEDVEAFLSLIK